MTLISLLPIPLKQGVPPHAPVLPDSLYHRLRFFLFLLFLLDPGLRSIWLGLWLIGVSWLQDGSLNEPAGFPPVCDLEEGQGDRKGHVGLLCGKIHCGYERFYYTPAWDRV